VGLIDVGTLGKIEVHGPHAAEFPREGVHWPATQPQIGMSRYGLMLDESGVVVDDGVVARLGAERFLLHDHDRYSATLFREFGRLATWWGLSVGLR